MLVLTRRSRESVVVGRPGGGQAMLTVTVLEINGRKVTLGFEGDSTLPVHRSEVWEQIRDAAQPDLPVAIAGAPQGDLDRWDNDGGGPGPLVRCPPEAVAHSPSAYDRKPSSGNQAATLSQRRDGCPTAGEEATDRHE